MTSRTLPNPDDDNALIARLELIASVLRISDREISDAEENLEGLIEFAVRYGQSLDWIAMGDVRGMIARLAAKEVRP